MWVFNGVSCRLLWNIVSSPRERGMGTRPLKAGSVSPLIILLSQTLKTLHQHRRRRLPRIGRTRLPSRLRVVGPKRIIAHIALHGRRHIIRIHHLNLTRDRSIGLREIGAERRLHQQRILLCAILAVAVNGRGDLRDTQEHRLERAQTESLALRTTDVDIAAIVEKVDVFVLVARVLRRNHHAVSKHLYGATLPLDFTGKNVKQRESATVALVGYNEQKEILQWESRHDLDKRNDQKIQALSRDVLVHRCE